MKQTEEAASGCKIWGSIPFNAIPQISVDYLLSVGHRAGFLFPMKGLGIGAFQMVFMEMVRGGSEQEHKEAVCQSMITTKLPFTEG